MKYRIITDTEDGFRVQRRGWFGIWWTCTLYIDFGRSSRSSFSTYEEANKTMDKFIQWALEESDKKRNKGKVLRMVELRPEDETFWKLGGKI